MNDTTLFAPPPVNVLVVDDIEKNLLAMQALLARPGLRLLNAASGVEALELLLEHDVALALIDVNMPQMDGFELAELMRGNARTRAIPLIFITAALHEPGRAFRGYQAGAVDFLHKPVDPAILRGKVEVFVELYLQRKQLEMHAAELKKALEINEMYQAVLGHDLRTPLGAILNSAELILHVTREPNITAAAKRILSSGERMTNMVSQLLELARARSGDARLDLARHDYRAVCEQLIGELAGQEASGLIELTTVGDSSGSFDHDRVSRILSNLIGNAVQHRSPDTPIKVRVDGTHAESVAVQVHNAGHIPAAQQEKIFEPYRSASPGKPASGHLGLGLYIVRQLAAAHGGSVTLRSTPEEGTCFELRIPRRMRDAHPE